MLLSRLRQEKAYNDVGVIHRQKTGTASIKDCNQTPHTRTRARIVVHTATEKAGAANEYLFYAE